MKQGLLSMLLLLLTGFAGSNLTVMAQVPEPTAQWTFDDTQNLLGPTAGNLDMIPAITGSKTITTTTLAAAGITSANGPTADNKAIYVPQGAALKVARPQGAVASTAYTIMIDFMTPDAVSWNGLIQMDEANADDGDLFTYNNTIGVASMGGYAGSIRENRWYRVVLTYNEANETGKARLYVNGEKLLEGGQNARHIMAPFGFYLFCDESGEMTANYVAEVAYWQTPLTDEQVSELGRVVPPAEMEISTVEDMQTFAQRVLNGEDINAVLTADIDLSTGANPNLMIGTQSRPFTGTFDGQGHTITYDYHFTANYCGLFSYINGATIRNLRVEGEVVTKGIHYGALIGYGNGTMLVENVVTNVHIIGEHSGVTGNGGMMGALYGPITFNNCATLGKMGYPGSTMYSSFCGFSNGSVATLNNCYSACEFTEGTNIDGNCYTLSHGSGTPVFNNCYYVNVFNKEQGIHITEEQIANGSLCYKLNGDQTNITWTQNIGTDPFPMPDPNGPRVFGSGTLRCDGAELPGSPLTYSNTESYPTVPAHQFGTDGICTVCGMTDPNAVSQDADGYYLIGNPDQLYWLYLKVQESTNPIKVRLSDDIDLASSEYPDLMIGCSLERPFIGIFDGAMHTITYNYEFVNEKWRGLFAFAKDCTIRNLRVEGSAYVTSIHYGALIGRGDGNILVENVVTNVDITGAIDNNVTGDAGMIGANYANLTFNNCSTHGEMGYPSSSMYSSYSGWSNGSSTTTLNNCYTTCSLTEGTGNDNCFNLTHGGGSITLNNSYYLNVFRNEEKNKAAIQTTEEEIESGELCYKLNGDQSNITWYQTLGDDEMPVPDPSHLRVYGAGNVFMNIQSNAEFLDFVDRVITTETERLDETYSQKSLEDAYLTNLNSLRSATDIDTFMSGFNDLEEQRQAIQRSAEAYALFIAKIEEATNYLAEHPELDNEKVDALRSYLEELDEPGDYPNGSAVYILDKCLLNETEIAEETARIDEMLLEAINFKPAVGSDMSLLFTNIDLSDRFNGWEGQVPTGWGTSDTSPLYAAECLATTMDMYQTVTGLENGIYELQINGAFRPTPYNDFYNVNYAATLYANDIHNFFQANIEDMISVDDAIDGVNCNITGPVADFAIKDGDEEVIGYTMQGIVSCCNAFQAGRYPNHVLCNVTDGTLTIGVRQPGTSLSRDWLGFGNIKVLYYGQLNEAGESLDRVLASQSARATTILNVYEDAIDVNDAYATYPNYSSALKAELQQTLAAVATTTEPAAKYALIEKFSELFLQIYESKQAYIHLMDMAEEVDALIDAFSDIISEEEFINLEDLYSELTNGYADGTMSTEEIYAIKISDYTPFFPEQDEEGYYLLDDVEDFNLFASMVDGGLEANVRLQADIDLSTSDYPDLMIGTQSKPFRGTFDGQGHTITYNYENVVDTWRGLFAFVDGATIRNLIVEGSAYSTNIHYGALIGRADGNVLVENVVTNVDITGAIDNYVTGDAGMVGANYANLTFNNCATLGTMGYPTSSMYSSYSGWSNGSSTTKLNNCYSACVIKEGTNMDGNSGTLTHGGGTNTFNNCYFLNLFFKVEGTQMTLDQFRSGEVCYRLNGLQGAINWYQTINSDTYPMPFKTHEQVFFNNEEGYYYNLINGIPVDIKNIEQTPSTKGHAIYNLAGQRLSKMQKGINIVDGKKILVK